MLSPYEIPRHRVLLLFLAFFLFSLAIGYRVFSFQVVQGVDLSEQAQMFRYREDIVPSERGDILDARGRRLATNVPADRVSVIVHRIDDPLAVAQALSPIVERSVDEIYAAITQSGKEWVVVARRLTPEASQQIAALNLPGLVLDPEPRRVYPMGEFAAQILGFVNYDYIGSYGVEGAYNDLIGGEPGHLVGERDGLGYVIALGSSVWDPPEDGSDIVLTIDSAVQRMIEDVLDETIAEQRAAGGTIIVQDPRTGAILGMASRPTFDPNHFTEVEDFALFNNPAIAANYEPGSTVKAIVMAIGLETHAVTPNTVHPGGLYKELPGGERVYNATQIDFGPETMTDVLRNSSNVGIIFVAEQLGSEDLYRGLIAFGFSEPTSIDLSGEEAGILPLPGDSVWSITNLYTNSFGQGMAVTPLQLTNAFSVLANGGLLMKPRIVEEVRAPNGAVSRKPPVTMRRVISEITAQTVTRMLTEVMAIHYTRFSVDGYNIAAKTGTAQIPAPAGGYEPGQTIASVIGYGPSEDPQFTVLVKIDRPQESPWGERAAGPAFKRVFEELFLLYAVPPSYPPADESPD
jgi:cell division protein FtsI (penicillin-binding protein 3)